jgi:hypothetical protein
MFMQLTNETLAMLWLGAGAIAFWRLMPAVCNALGLTFRRGFIDADAAALEPAGDDADYEELFTQLCHLGFEPVGRRSTTYWLFLHHWCKNFQARVFAARQGDCIALVYQLRPWDRWRLCFVTAFSDGAIVETANQMESFRIAEPDHWRWGLATPDRGLLLERHHEVCRDFAVAGSRAIALLPAEEVNWLNGYHESRHHRKSHRWLGLKVMSSSLWLFGIAFMVVRWFGGAAPYVVPASIIAWGVAWPAFHASLFRAAANRLRAADARRQRNQPTPGTGFVEANQRGKGIKL